jgi:sigma-E factor negative regulatory protein RseC
MMEEVGTVVELKGKNIAMVVCRKSSFCEHCASMEGCQMGDDNTNKMVEAHNLIGANVGDRVKLSVSTKTFLQSSFVVYIVPLLALLVGAVAGNLIAAQMHAGPDPNLLSAILGSAFLVGSFLVIKVGSRALPKEHYMPKIVGLVTAEDSLITELQHGH